MFDFLDVEELKEGVAEYGGKERGKWLKFWGKFGFELLRLIALKIPTKSSQKTYRKFAENRTKIQQKPSKKWEFNFYLMIFSRPFTFFAYFDFLNKQVNGRRSDDEKIW